jgi:hypothetical protein
LEEVSPEIGRFLAKTGTKRGGRRVEHASRLFFLNPARPFSSNQLRDFFDFLIENALSGEKMTKVPQMIRRTVRITG